MATLSIDDRVPQRVWKCVRELNAALEEASRQDFYCEIKNLEEYKMGGTPSPSVCVTISYRILP